MLIFGMVLNDGPIQLNDVKKHAFDLDESLIQRIAQRDMAYSYVDNKTDNEVLQIALNILSEEERTIVLLSAISGMQHREIAANLGLKLSTVLSKYHRAIKKMREYIRKEGLM